MSVEIELRRVSLVPTKIDAIVNAWLETSDEVKCLRLPDGILEMFVAGNSIRGFSLRRRWVWFRDQLVIRLNVCASEGD